MKRLKNNIKNKIKISLYLKHSKWCIKFFRETDTILGYLNNLLLLRKISQEKSKFNLRLI
jgi:hypothetical protein